MLNTQDKTIIINLLTLVPAIAQGIGQATAMYNRMLAALEDGKVSEEEWATIISERDALLIKIEADTSEG